MFTRMTIWGEQRVGVDDRGFFVLPLQVDEEIIESDQRDVDKKWEKRDEFNFNFFIHLFQFFKTKIFYIL